MPPGMSVGSNGGSLGSYRFGTGGGGILRVQRCAYQWSSRAFFMSSFSSASLSINFICFFTQSAGSPGSQSSRSRNDQSTSCGAGFSCKSGIADEKRCARPEAMLGLYLTFVAGAGQGFVNVIGVGCHGNKLGWLGCVGKLAAFSFIQSDNFAGVPLNGCGNGSAPFCRSILLPSGICSCSKTKTGIQ